VRIEIASALNAEKLVIPVLVGQARMPPRRPCRRTWRRWPGATRLNSATKRFAYDAEKLIKAMKDMVRPTRRLNPGRLGDCASQRGRAQSGARRSGERDDLPLIQLPRRKRYLPVLGEGNPDANIFFIGESPGKLEVEEGRPFCGPPATCWMRCSRASPPREDVYITNILLDRPPDNREPTPEELDFYAVFVDG